MRGKAGGRDDDATYGRYRGDTDVINQLMALVTVSEICGEILYG
jgi:hypothetical protein